MSLCRSCNKPISWVKSLKGKNMPVEGDYLKFDELSPGETIITDQGNVYKKKADQEMPSVKGRISHFSTCPNANDWRKK